MRYINLLLIFLFTTVLNAQQSPVVKSMKKKSGHVLKVKIVECLSDPKVAGPVVVEILEVYKSSSYKVGEQIAIRMNPFSMVNDSGTVNKLIPGSELIVFLAKGKPNAYTKNGHPYLYAHLYDDFAGWLFSNENLEEILSKKK